MCLTCTVVEEHGGSASTSIIPVEFYKIDELMVLGFVRQWRDKYGHPWWMATDFSGWTPADFTVRAESFRKVRGKVVVPLFADRADAEHALRTSFGLAVDA